MKLNLIAVLTVLLSYCSSLNAQVTFQKTFGDTGNDNGVCVIQTHDSGFVVAGYVANIVASPSGVYVIKTTGGGDTLWTKTFSSASGSFSAYTIIETHDHGLMISGLTNAFGAGNNDVYLIRTDSTGNLIWSKTFGGTGVDFGTSVYETTDGKFIITGYTRLGAGLNDIYLLKTDSAGNLIWSKTFGTTVNENAWSVIQDNNGDYVIGGYASGDPFILKTDTSGNIIFAKIYSGSGTDYVYSLSATSDGGYILSGQTTNVGAGMDDLFLAKSDSDGNIQWANAYGGSDTDDGTTTAVQTNDGGYILTGSTQSFPGNLYEAYLVKTDSSGNHLWSKTFGTNSKDDHGYSVMQTFDNGFVISGSTSSFGPGDFDVYLIKTNSTGSSGCNENVPSTIVTPFSLSDTTIHFTVTNPATVEITPVTTSGNGGFENTVCSSLSTGQTDIITDNNNFKIFPNPVADLVHISFFLSQSEDITLKLFGLDGKLISTMEEKTFVSGENDFYWNATGLSEGMYFIRVEGINFQITKKVLVVR